MPQHFRDVCTVVAGGDFSSAIKRLQIFAILLSYIYASLSVLAKCTYLKALLRVKGQIFPKKGLLTLKTS